MQFALLGNHPDGVAVAAALTATGRHQLAAYSATLPNEFRSRLTPAPRKVSDLEEILADPAIDLVVIAGAATVRPHQLRRALQAERHVLCVQPVDQTPE